MLRHKSISYTRRDLIPGAHRLLLVRLLGFPGTTVPALTIDRQRVLEPETPGSAARPSTGHVPRLGFPAQLAVPATGPVISLMYRLNNATDKTARADLPRIAPALDHVDQLIADSTIGNELPNAADFQLGAQVRMLMCLDDLRLIVKRYRCATLAMAPYPAQPGRIPPCSPTTSARCCSQRASPEDAHRACSCADTTRCHRLLAGQHPGDTDGRYRAAYRYAQQWGLPAPAGRWKRTAG